MSAIMSMVAPITILHWLMVASFMNVLAGLVLGMCLVMLVSAVGDEFTSTSVVEVTKLILALTHTHSCISRILTLQGVATGTGGHSS